MNRILMKINLPSEKGLIDLMIGIKFTAGVLACGFTELRNKVYEYMRSILNGMYQLIIN